MKKILLSLGALFAFAMVITSCSSESDPIEDDNNPISGGQNEFKTLINTVAEDPGNICLIGGVKILIGLDKNGNAILDDSEIESVQYVCAKDGVDGTDGKDGGNGKTSLIRMSTISSGDNCVAGGVKIESGIDDDNDGVLSDDEVQNTQFVCNGETPKTFVELVNVSEEPKGSNCENGGKKTETGLDKNENGILNDDEILKVEYQCDSFIKNGLALPSKLYMLSGVQNNIYAEAFTKRWQPDDYSIRFSGNQIFERRLSRVASITDPKTSNSINIKLVDNNNFLVKESSMVKVIAGESGVGENDVTASIIGDSYTQGGFFKDALLNKGHVPNLKLIGLRRAQTGQYDEGRGGWSLSTYFKVAKSKINYNPFFQPEGKKYWGSMDFWKTSHSVFNNTAGSSFEPRYSAGRYDDYLHLFDRTTGYKKNPEIGDVMYDVGGESFVEWNGVNWINSAEDDYSWSFNYQTYVSMWGFESPDFLFVMLGVNDFFYQNDPENIDFSLWNTRMEALKDSYLSSNPTGKFIVVIPCSTFGKQDNTNNIFTLKVNASLWSCRKNIIDTFDLREDEQIFVVDGGINIDAEYGYLNSGSEPIVKPFETFKGDEIIRVQTGVPHPYNSYPEIGKPIAAFIQNKR